MNTEDILARVNSIRRDGHANKHKRVEDWIEDMTVLSSYAETTYQRTIIDPTEMEVISESASRISEDSVLSTNPRDRSPGHSRHTVAVRPDAYLTRPSMKHAAKVTLGKIGAPTIPRGPTTAPSGLSPNNLDPKHLTSALTEDIDGTGNDTSHQLSLFGWKRKTSLQNPPLGDPGTGECLLFRTALKSFQHFSEAQVSGGQPPQPYRYCEVSLFEWLPILEVENAPSFVYFTITLPTHASDTPHSSVSILFSIPKEGSFGGQSEFGDEEVILTFFDAENLDEFLGHLVGWVDGSHGIKHEFELAGYNALEYGGLGTSARIPRPIDKLATTHTWPKVSLFEPPTLGPPLRLVFESQDGSTLINNRIGPRYHRFIKLGSTRADDSLLVVKQSLMSASRNNFLLFTARPTPAKPARIKVRELQGIHPEQQVFCEYRFQNLGSLHRFQRAMTGFDVLFDGWIRDIMFGRQDFGFIKFPNQLHWGRSAVHARVQILRDTGTGATRVAIFSPPSRRHPEGSQTSFQLSQAKHCVHYYSRSSVAITDDSSTLPSDTIDAWRGVSPNEGNFLDLGTGGGGTGKSNKVFFYCKEQSGKQKRLSSWNRAASWR